MSRLRWVVLATLLASCDAGHAGFDIEVVNDCEIDVEFLMDGGAVPAEKPESFVSRLESGESETYSVYAGDDGAYFWLLTPAESAPIAVPAPPAGNEVIRVSLAGSPCTAAVAD